MDGHVHLNSSAVPLVAKDSWRRDLLAAMNWSFLLLAALPVLLYQIDGGHRDFIGEVTRVFIAIVIEAMPFVLLGALVGGLIEVFVSPEQFSRILTGRPIRSVLLAGLLGILIPICECASIFVVRRLIRKGVPLSAAIAFLLAAPGMNPLVAGSTYLAYMDWRVVAARVGFGFAIAVLLGLLLGRLFRNRPATSDVSTPDCGHDHSAGCACDGHSHEHRPLGSVRRRLAEAVRHAAGDFTDIGRFLIVGAFVAAVLRAGMSQASLLSLAGDPNVATPIMMGLAYVLTLCSEADAFVAASFGAAVPLSAQMAFLLLGPMLDIKLTMMFFVVFRKRFAAALISGIVLAVFGASMLLRVLI